MGGGAPDVREGPQMWGRGTRCEGRGLSVLPHSVNRMVSYFAIAAQQAEVVDEQERKVI